MKKSWKYVDFRKLAGLEKDVETFMKNQTLNTGKRIQKEIKDLKRTRKARIRVKMKIKLTYLNYLPT